MTSKRETLEQAKDMGKRIAQFRIARNLTVDELAEKLGVVKSSAEKLLNGATCKQFVKLQHIAEVLGVTPNDFFGIPTRTANKPSQELLSNLQICLEQLLRTLDHDPAHAKSLAKSLLRVAAEPLDDIKGVAAETVLRIQSETLVREFLVRAREASDAAQH